MEIKHQCKLCSKSFPNGRALGGHMRSHVLKLQKEEEAEAAGESAVPSSSSEEDEEEKKLSYRLILQDRESETESSKNPTRRRSKRTRNRSNSEQLDRKVKFQKLGQAGESWTEPDPVSSISDSATEEAVAFCLMMLSRDKWEREETEKLIDESYESGSEIKLCETARIRGKFKCETCSKVFRSYQALGGHRASHKKNKVFAMTATGRELKSGNNGGENTSLGGRRIHECPICNRVFMSGQALGGHKRSHLIGSTFPEKNSPKSNENWIDLNLPAPVEDDEFSQIELSAVSDAEFVTHLR